MKLGLGFVPSRIVKINDERFTALATEHPMGGYLETFYFTGFYYTFVGVMQITALIFFIISPTVTLCCLTCLPIILNICLLSIAVRFEGSLFTAPLMVIACLYLLFWDWHKLKFIFFPNAPKSVLPSRKELNNRFPWRFFAESATTVLAVIAFIFY